ncbi:MAG: FAD-dependent monooxygenase [Bacteroidota bacterium]
METDVLIVGAGPTGLMLANQLARFGVDFQIIDPKSGPTRESRAMSVSSRSMEVYQQLGLADQILETSREIQGITMVHNGRTLAQVSLTDIGTEFSDFGRLTTTFEQNKNETLLYQNLTSRGKKVLWNYSFEGYEELEEGVVTTVKSTHDESTHNITSQYVVGCDGARSPVRHQLNVGFEGGTYDNKFYVADVQLKWEYGFDNVVMMPEKGVFVAFFPLQEKNAVRVIGTLPKEFADQDNIGFGDLQLKMKEVSKINFQIESVNWFSVYRIHHRVVDAFSRGRIFLAGDAAHIHSPAGGQGMNTGLQDAHNLGWKLAYVLQGQATPALLDTYNEERLPYAQALVNSTDKGFVFISGQQWWARTLRSYVVLPLFSVAMKYRKPAVKVFQQLSQLFYSYSKRSLASQQTQQRLKFKAGDRLPYMGPGYLKQLTEPNFYLIRISDRPLTHSQRQTLEQALPMPTTFLEDPLTEAWKQKGVRSELYLLVRPDQHLLYVGDHLDAAQLQKAFPYLTQ